MASTLPSPQNFYEDFSDILHLLILIIHHAYLPVQAKKECQVSASFLS
jgi:hypothetical protein